MAWRAALEFAAAAAAAAAAIATYCPPTCAARRHAATIPYGSATAVLGRFLYLYCSLG